MHRFYCPAGFAYDTVELTGAEAHHLRQVLRLEVGDEVELFDGRGGHAVGQIEAVAKQAACIRIARRGHKTESPPCPVILATAMPKGDRFGWLVEKATELGVARLIPLITQRSVVTAGSGKLDKLRRTVIEACKQCGRNDLMSIDEPVRWSDVVAKEFDVPHRAILIAHPGGERRRTGEWLVSSAASPQPDVLIAIGPEGGFADEEIELGQRHGARLVNLGPHVLRVETAAIAAVVLALKSEE
jgi:16S rRNA (uracil1498-N3)-methyltransferase